MKLNVVITTAGGWLERLVRRLGVPEKSARHSEMVQAKEEHQARHQRLWVTRKDCPELREMVREPT
jgi:hypothetical protein